MPPKAVSMMPRFLMLGGAVASVGLAVMTMSQTYADTSIANIALNNQSSSAAAPVSVAAMPCYAQPGATVVYSRQPLWLQRPRNL